MNQGQRYQQVQDILNLSVPMSSCVVNKSCAIILRGLGDVISIPLSMVRTLHWQTWELTSVMLWASLTMLKS